MGEPYQLPRSPVTTASHSVQAVAGMDSCMSPEERAGMSRKLTSCQCDTSQAVRISCPWKGASRS